MSNHLKGPIDTQLEIEREGEKPLWVNPLSRWLQKDAQNQRQRQRDRGSHRVNLLTLHWPRAESSMHLLKHNTFQAISDPFRRCVCGV